MHNLESPPDPARGLVGLSILAMPIVLVVFVFFAYSGMFALGIVGRAASEPITMSFEACPEAMDGVRARLEDMGFEPVFTVRPDGFDVSFVGPDDPEVRASLPADLSAPGRFEVREQDVVVATGEDVSDASVRVDALMVPTTLVQLRAAAAARVSAVVRARPAGQLDFYLDGDRIGGQTHAAVGSGEVEIAPPIDDPARRLRATAAWSVIIDHPPLPCPVLARRP